jgi:hypothetical protein
MTPFTYPTHPHVRRHGPRGYAAYEPALYRKLMTFPDDLPDLATLRPPDGNSRPDGIEQSYLVRRRGATLPETY